tara:strand:- start:6930 stop:7679 length:750 start_codon:yes stop_codon:yes gene_type:complete
MRFYTILFLHLSLLLAFSANAQEIDEILEREEESLDVADENVKNLNVKDFSSLEKLVPFDDIAVIQKRYLPRTKRFEFFPNVGMILNDAFFTNYIFGGKFAYHFSEKWGLEATYLALSQSEKQVVDDLDSEGVETTSILTPESYMGIDLKWVPIYGKMAWMNQEIIPFDFYFTFGLATLDADSADSPMAVHVGAGQSFAVNKYTAIRWDTSLYWYSAEVTTNGRKEDGSYMNLHLTIGASFFFPEAKYR